MLPDRHLPLGPLYPAFTFFQEIVTFLILIAVVWAFYRRYIEKLVRLKRGFKAGLVLLFIGGFESSLLRNTFAGPAIKCACFDCGTYTKKLSKNNR